MGALLMAMLASQAADVSTAGRRPEPPPALVDVAKPGPPSDAERDERPAASVAPALSLAVCQSKVLNGDEKAFCCSTYKELRKWCQQ